MLIKISQFDSNIRLLAALGIATLALIGLPGRWSSSIHLTLVWIAFALTVLLLAWITILVADPRDIPRLSGLEDSSRRLILLLVVSAAIASLFVVIDVLDSTTKTDPNHRWHILLVVVAIVGAWSLVHTVFTLRYAHLYYGDDPSQPAWPGGLAFPQEATPDYVDFAYFSFVIGMTSQVSDVAISSKAMRVTALVHGVLSFIFNALIIALTISGLSGLL